MKRSNSDIIHSHRDVKKTKPDDESDSDNEVPSTSLFARTKSNINLSEDIPSPNEMDFLADSHVSSNTQKLDVISQVKPPPILIKRSKESEAHLDLINKTLVQIRYKKIGKFIQLLPDTVDMHREIIAFLSTNNMECMITEIQNKPKNLIYNQVSNPTEKWIEVTITGLPCDTKTEQIKEALTEKDFDVENVVQMREFRKKKLLPLFQAVLPNSEKNENILKVTTLLNLKISVVRVKRSESQKNTTNCSVKNTHRNRAAKSKAQVPKCKNCCKNDQVVSQPVNKKSLKGNKNKSRKEETIFANTTEAKTPLNKKKHKKASKKSSNQKNCQELVQMAQSKNVCDWKLCKGTPGSNKNKKKSESTTDFQDIIYIMQEFRKLFGKMEDVKIFAQQLRNADSIEKFKMFSEVFLD